MSENIGNTRPGNRAGISAALFSAALVALGGFVLYEAAYGPAASTYARVGPGFFPAVVGIATIVVGLILAAQAIIGRWSLTFVDDTPVEGAETREDLRAPARIALVIAGLVANVALMLPLGFVISSTIMFTLTTRAFGSRNILRNVVVGLVFTGAIYLIFRFGLGLFLPAGRLWGW